MKLDSVDCATAYLENQLTASICGRSMRIAHGIKGNVQRKLGIGLNRSAFKTVCLLRLPFFISISNGSPLAVPRVESI